MPEDRREPGIKARFFPVFKWPGVQVSDRIRMIYTRINKGGENGRF